MPYSLTPLFILDRFLRSIRADHQGTREDYAGFSPQMPLVMFYYRKSLLAGMIIKRVRVRIDQTWAIPLILEIFMQLNPTSWC